MSRRWCIYHFIEDEGLFVIREFEGDNILRQKTHGSLSQARLDMPDNLEIDPVSYSDNAGLLEVWKQKELTKQDN